jgi:hypothetical protein
MSAVRKTMVWRREAQILEEAADRRVVAFRFCLRAGKIARLGRIGQRPGGKVRCHVALGQPAHGD